MKGNILIANPYLNDPNFIRSVILLCEHSSDDSFGFVLNKKTHYLLGDLVPELQGNDLPVFEGGPVETNTLHFLHQYPDKIANSVHITDNIYWGGNFQDAVQLILSGDYQPHAIKLFLGYSGWGANQVQEELEEKSWIVSHATAQLVFQSDENTLWKQVMVQLGGGYELLINTPLDPQWN